MYILTVDHTFHCRPFAISTTDYKDAPIAVEMDCSKKSSDRFICTFHFTNRDNQDYYLLDRHTPFEGFASPFITVTKSDDTQLDYEGALANPYLTTKKELVHLQAGTTKSVSVEVSSAYNFNGDGIYTIHYNTPLVYMSDNEFASLQESDSVSEAKFSSIPLQISESVLVENTANFPKTAKQIVLEEERLKKMDDVDTEATCRIAGIIGGSILWHRRLNSIHVRMCDNRGLYYARNIAANVNSPLYRKWFGGAFGAYNVYNAMGGGIVFGAVSYDLRNNAGFCIRPGNFYGYAFHGVRTVYLCDDFFRFTPYCQSSLRISGEGGLVHEWSHALGRTIEANGQNSYGVQNARYLANFRPRDAVRNADNYHFFYCDAKTNYFG